MIGTVEASLTWQSPASPVQPAGEERQNGCRPLVLVVEDHPAIRNMLSCVLDLQGFRAVYMTNGLEALNWLENIHHAGEYPAVILLDLVMPVMGGEVFLGKLRKQWSAPVPVPPVILFTVDRGNHANLACAEVLNKPFHIKDLLEKLQRMARQVPAASYKSI